MNILKTIRSDCGMSGTSSGFPTSLSHLRQIIFHEIIPLEPMIFLPYSLSQQQHRFRDVSQKLLAL